MILCFIQGNFSSSPFKAICRPNEAFQATVSTKEGLYDLWKGHCAYIVPNPSGHLWGY